VLVAHNAYQQRGGEDAVVETEVALLQAHGHEVRLYSRHNDEVDTQGRLRTAAEALWSSRTTREVGDLHIQARIETPQNLTKRQRELLVEFEAESMQQMSPMPAVHC
jgi:DnaJ-class molecular chaperone